MLYVNSIDFSIFRSDNINIRALYYLDDGRISGVNPSIFANEKITNSKFDTVVHATRVFAPIISNNLFDNSSIQFGNFAQFNPYGPNISFYNTKIEAENNVFLINNTKYYGNSNYTENSVIFNQTESTGPYQESYADYENYFKNNAILNNLNFSDTQLFLTIYGSYRRNSSNMRSVPQYSFNNYNNNYFHGMTEELINISIIDYYDSFNDSTIIFKDRLTQAPETPFPFVDKFYLLDENNDRIEIVGNQEVTFVVEFNI